ncbi:MAG: hypothetical protein HZB26_13425 [Candidatus Hydrogenedentes bacterium]|nr:hypothetical protein [Candidatus Hydrogenedentota bacterium]
MQQFDPSQYFGPTLIAAVIVLGIAAMVWNYLQEKKRREAFQFLAQKLGLRYAARDPSIEYRYGYLHALQQGERRYAFNILQGAFQSHPVCTFDFHYETHSTDSKGRRTTTHHYFSFFVLEQPLPFPELRIYPEGLLSKLGQLVGFQDIDFESAEFSNAFVVKSDDKKFAYDICHQRMMEYLLAHRDISLEIKSQSVAMGFNNRLDPQAIPDRLQQLVDIRNLFPEYLYHQ